VSCACKGGTTSHMLFSHSSVLSSVTACLSLRKLRVLTMVVKYEMYCQLALHTASTCVAPLFCPPYHDVWKSLLA
jgi:hypothetical protein